MSLSAKSAFKKGSAIRDRVIQAEAMDEIQDYLEGCLHPFWELSQEEADEIAANRDRERHDKLMAKLSLGGKSKGAKYIAARINSGADPDLYELTQDWFAHRNISNELSFQELAEIGARPLDLRRIGIKYRWEARAFFNLYREVMNKERVWNSSCQVSKGRVKALALTPNYSRLPMWVKKVVVCSAQWIETERIGNIWCLIDCAKAWKHAPSLPKGVAQKVGRLSPKSRILAQWAWQKAFGRYCTFRDLHKFGWDFEDKIERAQLIRSFWVELRRLSKLSLVALIEQRYQEHIRYYLSSGFSLEDHNKLRLIAELMLDLPHGFLFEQWGLHKYASQDVYLQAIASYGSPDQVCRNLFGNAGKRTVELFKNSSKDAWRWASAICEGNTDAVQKILAIKEILSFQPEAIGFLKSLPIQSRVRLLGTTTFKYRGVVNPLSDDYVRDTGYLWSNLQNQPNLGRIRCWFSVHEQMAVAFLTELPDEALPIPAGWERVDGLCAVDGSWSLEIPKRVETLKYYGTVLRNCVGGYGNAISSGRSVILAVREAGLLTHCMEVCRNYVNQFYRAGNSTPNTQIRDSVCAALEQAKLIY